MDTSDILIEKENKILLHRAIDRLPNQQKKIYKLVRDKGLKGEQVALQLTIQPETVKFHMGQDIKNIRDFCVLNIGQVFRFSFFIFRIITLTSKLCCKIFLLGIEKF